MTALILLSEFRKSQVEFWRPIAGWPAYDVSSFGNVRSYWKQGSDGRTFWMKIGDTPRLLKEHYDKRGYPRVILQHKRKLRVVPIHRLVAQAFLPNPENKPQVNHLSAYRKNNWLPNIEWATRKRNIQHAFENGLNNPRRGEDNNMASLTEEIVWDIRANMPLKRGDGVRLAEKHGVSKHAVYGVVWGRTWSWLT